MQIEYLSNVYNIFAVDQSALRNLLNEDGVISWENRIVFAGEIKAAFTRGFLELQISYIIFCTEKVSQLYTHR